MSKTSRSIDKILKRLEAHYPEVTEPGDEMAPEVEHPIGIHQTYSPTQA